MVMVAAGERGGFEGWEGFEGGFLLNDPWLHGTAADLARPTPVRGYQSDVVAERFRGWMRRRGESGPTFAVVSLEAPHPPYDAPAAGVGPWAPGEVELPANVPRGGAAEAKARRELAGYYAHIEATDRAIGKLEAVAGKDWIVVFTSVHGDMHGAHGLFRKGWPHEESVRVPLLVRRPGVAAMRDDGAVSLVDLAGRTKAWSDGAPPDPARPEAAISMPSVVALPHQCDRAWRGVRTRERKLVLNADGTPWLFFDLEADPLEMNNIAGDPARQGEIAAWRARVGPV
jgi:arylsulfatase A-like enzyme